MVGVTLVGLIAGGRSGVSRYAAALTSALDRVAPEFPDLRMRLLTTPSGRDRTELRHLELDLVGGAIEGPRRILAEQLAVRRVRGEVLHFFDLTAPLLAPGAPFVTTLHDAAIRHGFQGLRVAHKQVLQPLALRRARAVVAVSGFARDEGVTRFGADPARIHVIHSGPGLVRGGGEVGGPEATRNGYLLYVGNLAAHKNLPFLIRAFGAADVRAPLLLVGSWGDRIEEVRRAIEASPARERIELRSGVGDAQLEQLYSGARALLLPSLYEGFGFTALEAMSRGCPVVASDIPALREICRDGAWLLPPSDEPAWAEAIRRAVADDRWRDELRARGRAVAGTYSWESTARGVCELLLATGGAR